MSLFIVSLLCVYSLIPKGPKHEGSVGTDFVAFYTAGAFLDAGQSHQLYDLHAIARYQHDLAHRNGDDLGTAIGPWWNPPYYAWIFAPLAKFSYPTALKIWLGIDAICAAVALLILTRWLRDASGAGPGTYLLLPVLACLSTPFIQSLTHAQNTCTSVLLLTLTIWAWRKEWPVVAGLLLGLLAYKPQLVALVALVMSLCLGWRVLWGLALTGSALLAINLLTLPGTLSDYQHQLPLNLHFVLIETPYLWDRHVTLRAFWRLIFQGYATGETSLATWLASSVSCVLLGAMLFAAAMRTRTARAHLLPDGRRFDRLISATIIATPLLMPFYFDYDQFLLVIPATLLAIELQDPARWREESGWQSPSRLIAIWAVWFCWWMINPDMAEKTHVNVGVIFSLLIACMSISRASAATRRPLISSGIEPPMTTKLAA